jgi:hypothetical protein
MQPFRQVVAVEWITLFADRWMDQLNPKQPAGVVGGTFSRLFPGGEQRHPIQAQVWKVGRNQILPTLRLKRISGIK